MSVKEPAYCGCSNEKGFDHKFQIIEGHQCKGCGSFHHPFKSDLVDENPIETKAQLEEALSILKVLVAKDVSLADYRKAYEKGEFLTKAGR